MTDKNTWAHVVTKGATRREITEEERNGEGILHNNGGKNTEEDRHPIERETDQQQNDVKTTDNVPARSLTCEGNQYVEGERDSVRHGDGDRRPVGQYGRIGIQ